jgi:hypothetical protein
MVSVKAAVRRKSRCSPFAIRCSHFARKSYQPPASSYEPGTKNRRLLWRKANGEWRFHAQVLSFQDFALQASRAQDFTGVAQWNQDFTGYLGGGGTKAAIRRSPFARKSFQPPASSHQQGTETTAFSGEERMANGEERKADSRPFPLGYARGQDDKRYFIALIQETS